MRYGAVTFLYEPEALNQVDEAFRHLVASLHRIPFCASFGVSCASHWRISEDDQCYASPYAHLDIIVDSRQPHTAELLNLIKQMVFGIKDSQFNLIHHYFGPPLDHPIQVWEIRTGENGCLNGLPEYEISQMRFPVDQYPEICELIKQRYENVCQLWKDLAEAINQFANAKNFGEIDIVKRAEEFSS